MNKKVVEDAPEMRSVALHMAPLMPAARVYERTKVSPLVKSLPSRSSSHVQERKATGAVWDIVSAPPLPAHYYLERTHVYVGDSTVDEVACRIAEYMRKESIRVTFDETEVSWKQSAACSRLHWVFSASHDLKSRYPGRHW
jgi:hypothetical protein